MQFHSFRPRTVIFEQGEPGDKLHFLMKGTVAIWVRTDDAASGSSRGGAEDGKKAELDRVHEGLETDVAGDNQPPRQGAAASTPSPSGQQQAQPQQPVHGQQRSRGGSTHHRQSVSGARKFGVRLSVRAQDGHLTLVRDAFLCCREAVSAF